MFALVAIVKNEAERIDAFLDSAMAVCDVATIVDTGSTDLTIERIIGRGLTVHGHSWVNFGHSRSMALGLARGTADWLLALDADMTVEIDPDFEPDPAVEAYMIRMGGPGFEYRLPLLLRGDLPWQSIGAVHEYTALPDRPYVGVPTDKVRVSYTDRSSNEKSRWHATLLEVEMAEQPDNARTIFYLAQTYADLGHYRARALYQRRAEMDGWPEETFYAKYRAALLQPNWPDRLAGLLAAWEFRPSRLEPLHAAIKELNSRGQHYPAYQLAQVAVEPTTDSLFVHTGVWRWGMMFERAIAAWWVGRRDECRDLTERVLAIGDVPSDIRAAAEANLALC